MLEVAKAGDLDVMVAAWFEALLTVLQGSSEGAIRAGCLPSGALDSLSPAS